MASKRTEKERFRNRPTLVDLAAHAGVSRSTVSLVLRGSRLPARETRERVLKSIAALGYIYDRTAARLRARHSNTIGLVVCEITNPFYAELTAGIDMMLDEAGWVPFLANTGDSPERQQRLVQRMCEHGIDGLILCPAEGTAPDLFDWLHLHGPPVVQALRFVGQANSDYAGADNRRGMMMAVEHLIALGHRRIAFIGNVARTSVSADRFAGYLDALRASGIDNDERLVRKGPPTIESGAGSIIDLMKGPERPTAVVCFNDIVAFGAILGLQSLGLHVPRDCSVAGFDDVREASLWQPALTTVSIKPRQIGEEAARLLLARIAAPDGPARRVVMPPELKVRESSGPPPAKS